MRRGLKHHMHRHTNVTTEGSAPAPMRRGLKPQIAGHQPDCLGRGSAPAPMRRGLKHPPIPIGGLDQILADRSRPDEKGIETPPSNSSRCRSPRERSRPDEKGIETKRPSYPVAPSYQ